VEEVLLVQTLSANYVHSLEPLDALAMLYSLEGNEVPLSHTLVFQVVVEVLMEDEKCLYLIDLVRLDCEDEDERDEEEVQVLKIEHPYCFLLNLALEEKKGYLQEDMPSHCLPQKVF
jgi:hypothetical protein